MAPRADFTYRLFKKVWCPLDLGVPATRRRQYSALILGSANDALLAAFDSLHFRALACDGTVYLVATDEMQEREAQERSCGQLLSTAETNRLEAWILNAIRDGACSSNGLWNSRMAIVNITQNASFFGKVATTTMPALLRRSTLVDMTSGTPLVAAQHWLIQGFGHPDVALSDVAKRLHPAPAFVSWEHAATARRRLERKGPGRKGAKSIHRQAGLLTPGEQKSLCVAIRFM